MSPARPASRLATYFHVHLVSDSTGETLNAMAKAVIARFDGVIPIEHIYALVRSPKQMERVLEDSPSLARELEGIIKDEYPRAVRWTSDETGIARRAFPSDCPWERPELLDPDFLPDQA